jgi:hypothetical protein
MLRLRQICLVSPALEPVVPTICGVLGIEVCYRDPQVAKYGLTNAVMPIGNTFLEVVAPVQENTAAGRYLARRGGPGGYMVILDCDDIGFWEQRVHDLGIRIANTIDHPGAYRGLQLHPRDTGGALLEINWSAGAALDGPYHPAGPDWRGAHGDAANAGIIAAEIQSDTPETVAERWAALLDRPSHAVPQGCAIDLDLGTLRFVRATDGRGEGLGGIDVRIPGRTAIIGEAVDLCGTRVRLAD